MTIPGLRALMLPVLECFTDGKEHHLSEFITQLADKFNLTEEEQTPE